MKPPSASLRLTSGAGNGAYASEIEVLVNGEVIALLSGVREIVSTVTAKDTPVVNVLLDGERVDVETARPAVGPIKVLQSAAVPSGVLSHTEAWATPEQVEAIRGVMSRQIPL